MIEVNDKSDTLSINLLSLFKVSYYDINYIFFYDHTGKSLFKIKEVQPQSVFAGLETRDDKRNRESKPSRVKIENSAVKFRYAPGTASLARETRARRYGYGTRPAFRHKGESRFFSREWRRPRSRALDKGNFVGVINGNHARDAHARPIPRFTRPRLIVPPVSILHTSLSNAERLAHWETTASSSVHTRGGGTLSSPVIFYAILLPRVR